MMAHDVNGKYQEFLEGKAQVGCDHGFEPMWLHDELFDFQKYLVEWSLRKGRAAVFADCGLGKTILQLVWAQNVAMKTGGKVLILTPLSVSAQTIREGEKFGIECTRSSDGTFKSTDKIIVTNYERLHYFNAADFSGAVCDESSILKNFDGKTRSAITEFMRKLPYRLLCTATAAPNDYIELGTSSEALGYLGYMDMLSKFFKPTGGETQFKARGRTRFNKNPFGGKFRFRGHAQEHFWRWICSWARATRRPSDLGFDDDGFILPELVTNLHVVEARTIREGWLFETAAITMQEQRAERRRTINERCEKAAELVSSTDKSTVMWCGLNDEGDLLTSLVDGAKQVSGQDPDEKKEELFLAFQSGELRVLVTKPTIAGFGMNWQHCSRQTFFPSHSFEQWYQAIRRSWRFGQEEEVVVNIITSEGQAAVLSNLQRKAAAAEEMFSQLVALMNNELQLIHEDKHTNKEVVPSWL